MKLYVVGIGSGASHHITPEATQAIENSEIICGYTLYIEQIEQLFPEKKCMPTGMTKEVLRCKMALEMAISTNVAMVCSGDSSIYGMASLIYQIKDNSDFFPEVEVIVVPGITAAITGGAVLGSPLTNDFAVVSLSDLLTPMDIIYKRLEGIGVGDFVAVIYNPSSKKRSDYLKNACEIFLKYKPADTVCGWVRNIGRDGQDYKILTLADLQFEEVDMLTTVFIGNYQTHLVDGKMVTFRGYEKKMEDL